MSDCRARVALQAAELSLQELTKQLAEAAAALGSAVKEEAAAEHAADKKGSA